MDKLKVSGVQDPKNEGFCVSVCGNRLLVWAKGFLFVNFLQYEEFFAFVSVETSKET